MSTWSEKIREAFDAGWMESEHPREGGKFAEKSGESKKKLSPSVRGGGEGHETYPNLGTNRREEPRKYPRFDEGRKSRVDAIMDARRARIAGSKDESFEKLEHSLAHKKGVENAPALAAWIGRKNGKIK